MSAIPWKARLLTVIVILTNVAGNLLLSMGMKSASGLAQAILSPLVFTGVALLILWTITRVTLLSWADLSYVLPVTAIGYVLSAATGAFILHEYVSPTRWMATLLIVAGTMLAGTTPHKTTAEPHR
jgi:uncharacterized membrane protein